METKKNIALIDRDSILYNCLIEQGVFNEKFNLEHFIDFFQCPDLFDLLIFNGLAESSDNFRLICAQISNFKNPKLIFLISGSSEKKLKERLKISFKPFVLLKPFKLSLFFEQVNKLLVDKELSYSEMVTIGNFEFKPLEKSISNKIRSKIILTETEVKILKVLMEDIGKPLSKGTLLDRVWGLKGTVKTHTLETHVYRLRKKLNSEFGQNFNIKSYPGGYSVSVNQGSFE